MSKISSYNLEIQEQANELGFETTQQALDAGCVVEGDCNHPVLVEPLVAAHRAFEAEKVVLIKGLDRIADRMGNGIEPEDNELIEHVKKFIKEARE